MADAPNPATPPPVAEWSRNKRFIRTLETDSAAVKSGGKSGFVNPAVVQMPVLSTPEDALTRAVADSGSDAIDLDRAPAFDPARLDAIADTPAPRPVERLIGGSTLADIPALTAEMAPKPVAREAPRPEVPESLVPLHTYASDFGTAVAEQGATSATILAAEQDAGAHRGVPAPMPRADRRLLVIAAVLVALGVLGTGAAYWYSSGPQTVAVAPAAPERIFVDERAAIAGSGDALAAQIMRSAQAPLAASAVRLLSLASGTSTSVFAALQLPAPSILLRNINPGGSLAGIVNTGVAQSPFFILAVDSYSNTFYGMLNWEGTMQNDLATLYPLYPAMAPSVPAPVATSTAASTTPSAPAPVVPVPVGFRDEVVASHNARALRDTKGHTLIVYGYWDQNTLIVARDETAFAEILSRLANSKTAQ